MHNKGQSYYEKDCTGLQTVCIKDKYAFWCKYILSLIMMEEYIVCIIQLMQINMHKFYLNVDKYA